MRHPLIGFALALVACKGGGGGNAATGGGAAAGAAHDAAVAVTLIDGAAAVDGARPIDAAPPVDAMTGAATTPTPPGVVRVVLVHDVPLLRSEEKGVQRLASALTRGKVKGTVVDAGGEEAALLAAWAQGPPPEPMPPLPAAWASAPAVMVIEVRSPSGVEPRRQSGGLGARAVFRPPSPDPIYVERGGRGDDFDELLIDDGFLSLLPTITGGVP